MRTWNLKELNAAKKTHVCQKKWSQAWVDEVAPLHAWLHPGHLWTVPLPLPLLLLLLVVLLVQLLQLLQLLLLPFQGCLLFLHLGSHLFLLPALYSLEPCPPYGKELQGLLLLLIFWRVQLLQFLQPLLLHVAPWSSAAAWGSFLLWPFLGLLLPPLGLGVIRP